uniref:Mrr-like domain-containing protein n=1 Tax=viral metagenome TaxID=1070528 RepID=A0A6C0KVL0_9ZZZZ
MPLLSHLRFLEQRMTSIQHVPTLFEYYSAIHLTNQYQTPFYVYQDIPDNHKRYAGFPLRDKGVDLVNDTFQQVAQVKYYGKKSTLYYGNLSTFLATPLLVGKPNLRMILIRTNVCRLSEDIKKIIRRGDMKDITLCPHTFLQTLKMH